MPLVNGAIGSKGANPAQVQQALDESGLSVTGAGVKVGVLSDSFNNLGGAAADEADGALPPAADIQVLADLASGGSDEGRAMMQIIHDIAPGAGLAFYTAVNSEQDFANGILALAAAGCKVICDDISYFDEPFFQNGIVAQAIQTVEAEGVVYLTAAGNNASNAYQAAWSAISGSFDGQTLTDAESFSGSLVQTVTLGATAAGLTAQLLLEWNQAYGDATSDLEILAFQNGRLVSTATNRSSGEPTNPWIDLSLSKAGTYQIAVENLSGPNPGLIKEVAEGDGLPFTIGGANVGSVYGHAMTPGAITVGAVNSAETPAFGVNPAQSEGFSSSGAGTELLFSNSGVARSSPELLSPVAVSGVDDISTTLPNDLSDFYGTSASTASVAGVVTLMLQANPSLTPAQVDAILQESALPMTNSEVSGAGLVRADVAVADALAMGGSIVVASAWASGVSGDFSVAGNWNPAGVPGPSNEVALSAAGTYTVTSSANETVNSLSTSAGATLMVTDGAFTIEDGTGAGVNAGALVAAGGLLKIIGPIAGSGSVMIEGGSLDLDGTYAGDVVFSGPFGSFIGDAGQHNLVGNGGDNTLDYSAATSGVQFNLFTGLAFNNFDGPMVNVDNFSNISFFIAGVGTIDNDFIGGAGNHAFNGSSSFGNILDYSNSSGLVQINVSVGVAQNGFGGTDQFYNLQSFIGGSGTNIFYATSAAGATIGGGFDGNGSANTLDYSLATVPITFDFGLGSNSLTVGTSTTTSATDSFADIQNFNGGSGNDTFIGGPGNHVINGMGGVNTLDYSAATTGVQFDIAAGLAYNDFGGPAVTVDRFSNIDTFIGGSGNNVFYGGSGSNVLDGGAGGTNTLDYAAAPGAVSINLTGGPGAGTASNGYGGTDTFEHFQIFEGGALQDDFTANNGPGTYILVGGGNSDIFSFSGNFGEGTVTDFTPGNDQIYLAQNEFVDFAAVQSHAQQVGGNTMITLSASDSITLQGISLSSLNASMFHFL
jgi:hypothetical protein